MLDVNTRQNINPQMVNEELCEKYLTAEMELYFSKKLKSNDPLYLKLKIAELIKYLLLTCHSKGAIPFTTELDELWHLWILQTQQYYDLMMKMPAKIFIHHSSVDYGDIKPEMSDEEEENEINRQISFLVSYVHNFGELTEKSINFWVMGLRLLSMHSSNIDKVNLYLKSFIGWHN